MRVAGNTSEELSIAHSAWKRDQRFRTDVAFFTRNLEDPRRLSASQQTTWRSFDFPTLRGGTHVASFPATRQCDLPIPSLSFDGGSTKSVMSSIGAPR